MSALTNTPTWGSTRGHGLNVGDVFTYWGGTSTEPAAKGRPVRLAKGSGNGYELETVSTGRLVVTLGAASRYWASAAPATATKRAKGTPKAAKVSAKATPARRTAAGVKVPPHPGVAWREALEAKGLTQRATAKRMGVSGTTLNRIFAGHGIPTARVTVAFAKAIGTDCDPLWRAVSDYELALALTRRKRR